MKTTPGRYYSLHLTPCITSWHRTITMKTENKRDVKPLGAHHRFNALLFKKKKSIRNIRTFYMYNNQNCTFSMMRFISASFCRRYQQHKHAFDERKITTTKNCTCRNTSSWSSFWPARRLLFFCLPLYCIPSPSNIWAPHLGESWF